MIKIEFKAIIIRILVLVGTVALCLVGAITIMLVTNNSDESAGISVPLEGILVTERYYGQIGDRPLVKSELVQVVRVKVLNESPKSATIEILYDSKNDAPFDNVWVSAGILKDTGLTPMHYTNPEKAVAGHGKKAIVKLGISDEANFEVLASNSILINFYKGGQSPFHEVKYEYQRIWCRKITKLNNLWKRPYPVEKGSKYSINGTRTVSRLCLDGVEGNI